MDLKRNEICNGCSAESEYLVNLYVFGNRWDAEPTLCESCFQQALKVIENARNEDRFAPSHETCCEEFWLEDRCQLLRGHDGMHEWRGPVRESDGERTHKSWGPL